MWGELYMHIYTMQHKRQENSDSEEFDRAPQALSLSVRDRLRLASELLVSVEPPGSAEIERAWEEEIQRRIGEIDSGNAKGRGWDEIKRDFHSRYGK
jgi:putative addiction module component (TIGR02574 family)